MGYDIDARLAGFSGAANRKYLLRRLQYRSGGAAVPGDKLILQWRNQGRIENPFRNLSLGESETAAKPRRQEAA